MREEDFRSNNDTDRQRYLNDLERLRRIKENERYNNQNKSVSEYIEDYYYDADDSSEVIDFDDGYGEYENFLIERSQRAKHSRENMQEDAPFGRRVDKTRQESSNHANRIQENKRAQQAKPSSLSKREEYLESIRNSNIPIKRKSMQTGVKLPELNGDLDQRRLAIQRAKQQAIQETNKSVSKATREHRTHSKTMQSNVSHPKSSNSNGSGAECNRANFASKNLRSKKNTVHALKPTTKSGGNKKGKEKEKEKTPVPLGVRFKTFIGNVIKIAVVSLLFFAGFLVYSFYTKQEGYYTIAIFGVDSRNGNVGKEALADVNMIANINRETGAIQLVSIYRDTITEIDGKGNYHKLNEAYFKGGANGAVAALERNLDLDIEGYATFNWKAVVDGINILGGIDLEITEAEFKYINGFITETVEGTGVGSHHLKQPGMNHLDGVQAVAYARLRLMDTDFNRTERQRKVVKLAMEKAKNADFATINNIMVTVLPQLATNLTLDDLIPFAKDLKKYYLSETTGFPFELVGMNIGKKDYVIPVTLKSNVIKLHSFLYAESGTDTYTPSAKLKEISKYIISVSGQGEDKDDIEIKIDKGGDGGIGPKGGGNSSATKATEANENTKSISETESVENVTSETETTTQEQISSSTKETETEARIEPQTLTPETTQSIQDQGDAGIPDDGAPGNSHNPAPAGDALSDDVQNGPGVNP